MSGKQTESGKSLEYAIATAMGRHLNVQVCPDKSYKTAKDSYLAISDDGRALLDRAARKFAIWVKESDHRLSDASRVHLQPDWHGKNGDARDIVITTISKEIGISAKNNHEGVKASRLSDSIDFGKEWADCPVSPEYFKKVRPIFNQLRQQRERRVLFQNLPNKASSVYLPVLAAFEDELRRLCDEFRDQFVSRLFEYLLGRYDFYKVIKRDSDQTVTVQSMNMHGTLEWGRKWKIPTILKSIERKPRSESTLLVSFDGGWQLSFRLHNASRRVEPSLKFDILFVGFPPSVAQHQISLA